MGRGAWIGIGVVIGIIVALVLVSVLPWISPGTAATMHLLKISTVTMPIYAGTRTVTTTATTTVTKYLGGKVITVTSTATRTLTMYRTVTATPHLLTTVIKGTRIPLWYSYNGGVGYAGYIKIHNHTLYVLIKTVTRVYREYLKGAIEVPREGFVAYPFGSLVGGKDYRKYIASLIYGSSKVVVIGTPPPMFLAPAIEAKHGMVFLSVRACEAYLAALASYLVNTGAKPKDIEFNLHAAINDWKYELSKMGVHTLYCERVTLLSKILSPVVTTVILTDKYTIALLATYVPYCRPTSYGGRYCVMYPLALVANTSYVLKLAKILGIYSEIAPALEKRGVIGSIGGCINPMPPNKFWNEVENFANAVARGLGA